MRPATGYRGRCFESLGPSYSPRDQPITVPLRPGTEYYICGDVPRSVENSGTELLVGIAFLCHQDRPYHAHAFSPLPSRR